MDFMWVYGDYELMPWVVDIGLVCLGEPVCGIGVLWEVKTNEVLGWWICVWVVGFVWTCLAVFVFVRVEFGSCVRQAVYGLMIIAVDICFVCMWMRFYEYIEITVNPSV